MPTTVPRQPFASCRELGAARLGKRHGEDRAHSRPHGFHRERVDRLPDQDHAGRADGVGGAHDRAEVAGIAHRFERHPHLAGARPDRAGRREPLLEDAEDGLRVVAPADLGEHRLADRDHAAALRMGRRGEPRHQRLAATPLA